MMSLALLAKTGSLLEAAQRHNLTPSAVHKHLKALEEELGVTLYEKRGDSLKLTQAGKVVLPFFNDILSYRQAALDALSEWKRGPGGIVRLGVGPVFSTHLLPSVLRDFRRKFKGVEVYVETGNSEQLGSALRSGNLDLVFDLTGWALSDRRVSIEALWTAPLGVICALDRVPTRCSWRDLEDVPFVLFPQDSRMDGFAQNLFAAAHFRPRVAMRSDNADAINAMVKAGMGVALVFLWNVNQELRSGQVRVLRLRPPSPVGSFSLMRMASAYVPSGVRAFVETLRRRRWEHLTPAVLEKSRQPGRFPAGESSMRNIGL